MFARALTFAIGLFALPASAQDYAFSNGPLSDEDFYRLVACGARPGGGECRKPLIHWNRDGPIRVAIRRIDPAFLGGKRLRAFAAVERALQEINRVDTGLRLAEVADDATADVEIFFLDIERGDTVAGVDDDIDGTTIGNASVRAVIDDENNIQRAVILFSTTLDIRFYESVMLEELTQSLGLMTDIKNPYYDDKSIFSQDTSSMKTLGAQDRMALVRHYDRTTRP